MVSNYAEGVLILSLFRYPEKGTKKEDDMGKKYTALRIIATIYKILAWFVLVLGIISFIVAMVTCSLASFKAFRGGFGGGFLGFLGGISVLIYTVIVFIGLLALSEAIYVVLDIEENTRKTAMMLEKKE